MTRRGLLHMLGAAIAAPLVPKPVPNGILTLPGPIDAETAARVRALWQANYSGTWVPVTVFGNQRIYVPSVRADA